MGVNVGDRRCKSIWNSLLHRKSFVGAAAVTFLLALLCVARILVPNRIHTFEGTDGHFVDRGGSGSIPVFQNISLSPGVYRVKLDYSIDTDGLSLCTVEDDHVYPGALLVNYDVLYANRTSTDFMVWLFEPTDALSVTVSLDEASTLMTGSLTIVETDGLWTMLLTILLFCGACVMGGILFSVYQKEYGVSARAKGVFLSLAAITLLSSTPFLLDGMSSVSDLHYHYHRIEAVSAGLASGQFPVRIAPRWLYGQGYADPMFYCNLLLVFPAALRLLGFPLDTSYQVFAVCVNALTAWVAYYSYSRMLKDDKAGICCSALYTLSTIHGYKLLYMGALGEGTAHVFMPLVLLGLYETFSTSDQDVPASKAWLHLALGYGGLFQTHVLSSEITMLVTLLFCLAYVRRLFRKPAFFTLLKGTLGAVAVSLWFLVPFADYFLTQDVHVKHVSARTIQYRGADLGHFFRLFERMPVTDVAIKDGMYDTHPFGTGLVLTAGLAFFLILWYSGKLREKSPLLTFVKVSAVLSAVLMLFSLQAFPWDRLQALHPAAASLISSLQFPTRFLSWATCLLIVVMGYCLVNRRLYFGRAGDYLAAGSVLLAVFSAVYLLEDFNQNLGRTKLYSEEGMGFGYLAGAEYLIQGTDEFLLTFDRPRPSDTVSVSSYVHEMLHVTVHCTNAGSEQGYLDVPLLLYKGYHARDVDSGAELEITHNPNNQVRVLLPASFSGTVDVRFVSPFYWRLAEVVSLAAVTCLLGRPLGRRVKALCGTRARGRRHHEEEG